MGLEEFIIRDTNDLCGVRTSAKATTSMNRGSNAMQFDTIKTQTPLRNPHQDSTSIITPAIDSSVESASSAQLNAYRTFIVTKEPIARCDRGAQTECFRCQFVNNTRFQSGLSR